MPCRVPRDFPCESIGVDEVPRVSAPNKFAADVGTDLPPGGSGIHGELADVGCGGRVQRASGGRRIARQAQLRNGRHGGRSRAQSHACALDVQALGSKDNWDQSHHLVEVSQPRAVASVIEAAARFAGEKQSNGHVTLRPKTSTRHWPPTLEWLERVRWLFCHTRSEEVASGLRALRVREASESDSSINLTLPLTLI